MHAQQGFSPVPVVNFGNCGVIRCRRCRTYMNPFVSWLDAGRRWRCNGSPLSLSLARARAHARTLSLLSLSLFSISPVFSLTHTHSRSLSHTHSLARSHARMQLVYPCLCCLGLCLVYHYFGIRKRSGGMRDWWCNEFISVWVYLCERER